MSEPLRDELNPRHPVTIEMREQWHKLAALVMFKMGLSEVQITETDIDAMMKADRANIVVDERPKENVIILRLVSDKELLDIARKEGRRIEGL